MRELIDKLEDKGYDWGYIHLFLSVRNIGGIFINYPLSDLGIQRQYQLRAMEQKRLIAEALVEVDFLRHV